VTATDSGDYTAKKRFFDSLLTVYGRKPVLEVLQDAAIPVYRLHMATSNQEGGIVRDIEKLARARNIDIVRHSRESLSRISKNRNQDQGIAIDLACPGYCHYRDFLQQHDPSRPFRLIALDRITNPQNLGMIIRSVSASPFHGLLLPAKGCAPLSPLVIKASAGTLFRCPILRCDSLETALADFRAAGSAVCVLTGNTEQNIADYQPQGSVIYVLGNESDGVSAAVMKLADARIRIPMHNGVESLNVAVTAALIAFRDVVATTR
jgi:23S rRNA (guanosine2251-2'-O)-methyltransferase